MKITKSELREMIREVLREELVARSNLEETLEDVFEGIFDSKADRQKRYNQIIADAFDKKAPLAIANEVANNVESALGEAIDDLDNENVSSSKALASNFISAITSAKVAANKNTYGLITSVISFVQKNNRDAQGLEELIEFKHIAIRTQSSEKDGKKAIDYLMEIVNKQLIARLDRTIAFLKKEYSI